MSNNNSFCFLRNLEIIFSGEVFHCQFTININWSQIIFNYRNGCRNYRKIWDNNSDPFFKPNDLIATSKAAVPLETLIPYFFE